MNFEFQIWSKKQQKELNIFVVFHVILFMFSDVIVGLHETMSWLYLRWEMFPFYINIKTPKLKRAEIL